MKIFYLIYILILFLIIYPIRINTKILDGKYLLFELVLFSLVKIRIKKKLNEIDITKQIRKFSSNINNEKEKMKRTYRIINMIKSEIIIENYTFKINTNNEYIYFLILNFNCYISSILHNQVKKIKDYEFKYIYDEKTSYSIMFNFSFTLYNVLSCLFNKSVLNRSVQYGKQN